MVRKGAEPSIRAYERELREAAEEAARRKAEAR
jgi:hypothetical protein